MIMDDDAKKAAATIIVGLGAPAEEPKYESMKIDAAQEIINAIKDESIEDLVSALSAFVMLCDEEE